MKLPTWLPWAIVVLLAGFLGWQYFGASVRTVTVQGEATVQAAPDRYVFRPMYESLRDTEKAARVAVTETGSEALQGLRDLGVEDEQLSTSVTVAPKYSTKPPRAIPNSSSSSAEELSVAPYPGGSSGEIVGYTGSYQITVTLTDATVAQTVLDYLNTTELATGAVTPYSSFQPDTRRQLERDAQVKALEDAQAQAEATARTLDVRLLGVEAVENTRWGGPIPLRTSLEGAADDAAVATLEAETTSPELLVGQQDITYTVSVTYRIR